MERMGLATVIIAIGDLPNRQQSEQETLSTKQSEELEAVSERLNASATENFFSLANSKVEKVSFDNLETPRPKGLSSNRPMMAFPGREENFTTRMVKRPIKPVAAVEGGGVRGIGPMYTIKHIEHLTNTSFCKGFPVAAGSSAGSIVVAGLGVPSDIDPSKPAYTAEKLLDIFQSRASEIFPSFSNYNPFGWYHKARSLINPEFGREGLHNVLLEYYKDKPLSSCINEVVIPAAEVTADKAWFFSKSKISVDPRHCIISPEEAKSALLTDVVESSSAAPAYFYPKEINIGGKKRLFTDAVLFANNPSTVALTEAMSIYGPYAEYVLCSFGTGSPIKEFVQEEKGYGTIYWGRYFPEKSIRTTEDAALTNARSTLHNCSLFFTGEKDREEQSLFILSPDILEKDDTVADTSKEHIDRLIAATQGMIEDRHDEIRTLCKKITAAQGVEFD